MLQGSPTLYSGCLCSASPELLTASPVREFLFDLILILLTEARLQHGCWSPHFAEDTSGTACCGQLWAVHYAEFEQNAVYKGVALFVPLCFTKSALDVATLQMQHNCTVMSLHS